MLHFALKALIIPPGCKRKQEEAAAAFVLLCMNFFVEKVIS